MGFFEILAPFYDRLFHGVQERQADMVLAALQLQPGEKYLDAGAGTGYLVSRAVNAGAEAVGIDLSRAMLAQARKHYPKLTFLEADVCNLPFSDSYFDAVSSVDAIHHFRQQLQAFKEIYRVLKPGGRFVILDFDRRFIGTRIMGAGEYLLGERPHYFTTDELEQTLRNQGFRARVMPAGFIEYLAVAEK